MSNISTDDLNRAVGDPIQRSAETDYRRARSKAFWHMVFSALRGQSNKLIPYQETKDHLRLSDQIYRGVRAIRLDRIVGSVGRYRDFDRAFLPTQTHTRQRWQRVDRAHLSFVDLPPIQVYQVGEVYFVRDGNHRVSVARQSGAQTIQAHVWEFETRVPVESNVFSYTAPVNEPPPETTRNVRLPMGSLSSVTYGDRSRMKGKSVVACWSGIAATCGALFPPTGIRVVPPSSLHPQQTASATTAVRTIQSNLNPSMSASMHTQKPCSSESHRRKFCMRRPAMSK